MKSRNIGIQIVLALILLLTPALGSAYSLTEVFPLGPGYVDVAQLSVEISSAEVGGKEGYIHTYELSSLTALITGFTLGWGRSTFEDTPGTMPTIIDKGGMTVENTAAASTEVSDFPPPLLLPPGSTLPKFSLFYEGSGGVSYQDIQFILIPLESSFGTTLAYEYPKSIPNEEIPVPEPGTLLLVGLGGVGLAAGRRFFQRKKTV